MSVKSTITHLNVTVKCEDAVFNFTGNVSVVEALSLLNNFTDFYEIISIILLFLFLYLTQPTF